MPLVETVFPPIKCLKNIPLVAYPQDCLSNFKNRRYCSKTCEAIITDNAKGDILYVHDPMLLVNLSKADLKILSKQRILFFKDERDAAYTFEHVVHVCMQKGFHSENLPLKN